MISERQLRRMIEDDPRYSHLTRKPIEYLIAEIRRLRLVDDEYNRINNRQFEYEED